MHVVDSQIGRANRAEGRPNARHLGRCPSFDARFAGSSAALLSLAIHPRLAQKIRQSWQPVGIRTGACATAACAEIRRIALTARRKVVDTLRAFGWLADNGEPLRCRRARIRTEAP